jgi:hypothetical protein
MVAPHIRGFFIANDDSNHGEKPIAPNTPKTPDGLDMPSKQ